MISSNSFHLYLALHSIKEIKNAPECIVELHEHAGSFTNTREVHNFYCFFYKMLTSTNQDIVRILFDQHQFSPYMYELFFYWLKR